MIPPDDRGLTLGDGLFETVLSEAGRMADWDAHMNRLAEGCAALGLPAPDVAAVADAAERALAGEGLAQARAAVRITWTAGSGGRGLQRPAAPQPRLIVTAAPAPLPQGPARLALTAIRRNETSPAARFKTLSYLDNVEARRLAVLGGADEALMLNTRGEIACAAAANVFWFCAGALHTPALECGALAGITRARLIGAAAAEGIEVREVRAGLEALDEAEGLLLTNSLIGARPVAALDGRLLPQPVQLSQSMDWTLRGRR